MEPWSHAGSPSSCPYPAGPAPLHGRALEQDLDAVYAGLRRRTGPVVAVEIAPGVGAWLVLGHREVLEVVWHPERYASDPRRWNAVVHGLLPEDSPLLPLLGPRPTVSRLDGEEHLRHRRAMTAALGRIDLRQLSRLVRRRANALVDALAAGGTADLVAQYSRPLVRHVYAQLLGLPEDAISTMDPLIRTVVNTLPGAAPAEAELLDALRRLVAARSAAPGPDLSSWLAQEAPLTDDEIAHNLLDLVLIGGESVVGWIGDAVRLFCAQYGPAPVTGPGGPVPLLVEQALCTAAPVPNITGRWATADVILAGYRIQAGELVIPCLAAANADPELGDTPALRTRAHLAWGTGSHGCPAKDAARLVVETAVEVLLDRLPDVRPTLPDTAGRPSLWCGAPAALPVVFSATGPGHSGHGTAAPPPAVMDAPARRRDGGATDEAAHQRWGWWNSFGGGW
ncbi:cytochrome P450 [Streptomyces sp. NPDC048045]|uniref:cytochrome P450 n=1 Tax=Streptomyces sp. NPDC048045 TaxID=3154710 RepID=UPI00343E37B8